MPPFIRNRLHWSNAPCRLAIRCKGCSDSPGNRTSRSTDAPWKIFLAPHSLGSVSSPARHPDRPRPQHRGPHPRRVSRHPHGNRTAKSGIAHQSGAATPRTGLVVVERKFSCLRRFRAPVNGKREPPDRQATATVGQFKGHGSKIVDPRGARPLADPLRGRRVRFTLQLRGNETQPLQPRPPRLGKPTKLG